MKLFKDKNLSEEIEELDLGIVEAGESKKFVFYVLNDSMAYLKNLKFEIEHSEVKILDFPEKLQANKNGELLIEWNPSITLKEGLKAQLKISGTELWG